MKNAIWVVALLSMALAGAACGDSSDNGGDAGSGGSSGAGGTSGDACTAICNSPCVDDLSDLSDDDIAECVRGCGTFFAGCESETLGLLDCLEDVDCDEEAAASQCTSESLAFGDCFSGGIF